MTASTRFTFALVTMLAALGCDQSTPPKTDAEPSARSAATTPKAAESSAAPADKPAVAPQKKLAELLVGNWSYESIELPGTPEATKKQIEAEMKKTRIEFKAGEFVTYMNDKVFSKEGWAATSEEGRKLTITLAKTKKTETYEMPDDDTLIMNDKELGKVVLKRQK